MTHSLIWIWSILISIIVYSNNAEVNIHGTTANGWEFVRDLFRQNFEQERDLGGSVAIYYQGKLVIDLWGGWFDQSRTKPYDNDTLQLVFSTSKGLVATAVALCVQQGLLNYSALVTEYWPEYGQNGKENTTVADILSHRAGLANDSSSFEQYLNWTAMIHKLETQKPQWPPGTAHGYHALTFGWLAGELVRRVDPKNRTLGQFIRDEIAKPLQIEFYIGLPSEELYRVSPLDVKSNGNGTSNDSIAVSYEPFIDNRTYQAEIPAANGITNARSVARLYASLMDNIEDNKYKRILNEEILKRATQSNTPGNEIDAVLNFPTKFGMGFLLLDEAFPSFGPVVFGHSGNFNYTISLLIQFLQF
jgi:CubicO group peptidase (beta-lactamase class C family)